MVKRNTALDLLFGFFSLLIAVALVNWGLVAWFEFNIVEWISFGVTWLPTLLYSIVAVLGLIGLIGLFVKWFS